MKPPPPITEAAFTDLMNAARETNHTRDATRRSAGGHVPLEFGPWAAINHIDYLLEMAIKTEQWKYAAQALDYLRAFVRKHREVDHDVTG
jgi:hypothetical protein